jgi:hypothetical protein
MTFAEMRRELARSNKEFESAMRLLKSREKRKLIFGLSVGALIPSIIFLALIFSGVV